MHLLITNDNYFVIEVTGANISAYLATTLSRKKPAGQVINTSIDVVYSLRSSCREQMTQR